MPSGVLDEVSTTRSVQEAFLELLVRDDEFVRAEFEALVDACWNQPPPPPPARPRPGPRPPQWPVGPPDGVRFVAVEAASTGNRWCRQRGPPGEPASGIRTGPARDA
ncbi:hypothetical protein [Plantactinospora sp. WMMB782]|uniref:hypothetical protein n=1 Tax=Plantactinospora sp. WMMB782 TaxID=3404121 RepID=UPI003B9487C1